MTLDEITAALGGRRGSPHAAPSTTAALCRSVGPSVNAVADKPSCGVYLLPSEANMLLYGPHVLAAARHPALAPPSQL
jgi:hypothetical protein